MPIDLHTSPIASWVISSSEDFELFDLTYKFEHALNVEDEVIFRFVTPAGILHHDRKFVKELARKQIPSLPAGLLGQFVDLEQFRALIFGEKELGGHFGKRTDLAFQHCVAWLFSSLGLSIFELEGTSWKEFTERGTRIEIDMLAYDFHTGRSYIIDCTIHPPDRTKIDNIANAQTYMLRRGILVEPLIVVREPATETKKNERKVKVLDRDDLSRILDLLRANQIGDAKRVIG
jgi:hypothetical protein